MAASPAAPRILVADDQSDVLEALKLLLKGEGYEVEAVASPRGVLAALDKRDFDALLIDMNYARDTTSGAEGMDLLAQAVITMTGGGASSACIRASKSMPSAH